VKGGRRANLQSGIHWRGLSRAMARFSLRSALGRQALSPVFFSWLAIQDPPSQPGTSPASSWPGGGALAGHVDFVPTLAVLDGIDQRSSRDRHVTIARHVARPGLDFHPPSFPPPSGRARGVGGDVRALCFSVTLHGSHPGVRRAPYLTGAERARARASPSNVTGALPDAASFFFFFRHGFYKQPHDRVIFNDVRWLRRARAARTREAILIMAERVRAWLMLSPPRALPCASPPPPPSPPPAPASVPVAQPRDRSGQRLEGLSHQILLILPDAGRGTFARRALRDPLFSAGAIGFGIAWTLKREVQGIEASHMGPPY
jgi:hypothetical protein